MRSLLYLLKNNLQDCSPSEKRIGEYILSHSKEVLELTMTDVAKNANGSPAAIVRLCRRLNIAGFQELKILLAKDVYSQKNEEEYSDFTFSKEDGTSGNLDKILYMYKQNLDSIKKVINIKDIEIIIKKILSSRLVHIAGLGASSLASIDLHQKLLRIGILSRFEADSQLQLTSACTLGKEDIAIYFSYSGETKEIIHGAQIAKSGGAYVVGVTKVGNSELAKTCDIILPIPFSESTNRYGATFSRINQLIIVDTIYTNLFVNNLEKNFNLIEHSYKKLHSDTSSNLSD